MSRFVTAFSLVVVGAALLSAVWWWAGPSPDGRSIEFDADTAVMVLTGDGVAGVRDGPAAAARFSEPYGVAVAADGSIYVADADRAQRIRRVAPDGVVTTVAGGAPGYTDGTAHEARFDTPSGLAIEADGSVLVADTGNHVIRRIAADGSVATVAGDGIAGYRDGPARQARFNGPVGVAVAGDRIVVADTYNDRIRAIGRDGQVTTIAGTGEPGWADGAGPDAAFDTPAGVAVDAASNIYVADFGNAAVRQIAADGRVTTIPHGGVVRPAALAVDPDGLIYVAGDDRVVELRAGHAARVIAGSGPGFEDGRARRARFRGASGVALAAKGVLIVADSGNALLRRITSVPQSQPALPASPLLRPAFDADAFGLVPLLWPFAPQSGPFEITATLGEPRGAAYEQRFHAGLDVASPEGTAVVALRDGRVAGLDALTAFDTLSEAIRVGPIHYVHLRAGRDRTAGAIDLTRFVPTRDEDGRLVRLRVRRGARFQAGDQLGTLNAFNHAHINIGWRGGELNPLRFRLPHFSDRRPPVIAGVQLFAGDGSPIVRRGRSRPAVSGPIEIVVDAWDQVDGNAARRRLGVYALGYQVLHADGSPAPGFETPRQTIVFDRLPDDEDARLVFADGSGIPQYGAARSRFLYRVTNTFRGGVAAPGRWDTTGLAPGDYTLRIVVADISGNTATRNRDVAVRVLSTSG